MTPFSSQLTRDKKIGIALGSGSARGLAHVGILEALRDRGVEPSIVCGTSIGALVGACYVTGHLEPFSKWASDLSTRNILHFMNLRLWASGGMADATRLIEYLREQCGDPDIESLGHQFATVSTDLYRGRELWLQSGPIWSAVRASIGIPGILTPVLQDERWLVDGALVNPIPVSVCRALGADVIIGVNLNSDLVGRRRQSDTLPLETSQARPFQPNDGPPSDEELRDAEPMNPVRHRLDEPAPEEENQLSLLGRISASLREATEPMRSLWSGGPEPNQPPGTLNVMMSAINIMQDRITRSRLAGEPADVILSPRLADIGFLEFNRGAEAIAEGRACVERMLPAIEHALSL